MIARSIATLVGATGFATLFPSEAARGAGNMDSAAWSGETPLHLAFMWASFNLFPTVS